MAGWRPKKCAKPQYETPAKIASATADPTASRAAAPKAFSAARATVITATGPAIGIDPKNPITNATTATVPLIGHPWKDRPRELRRSSTERVRRAAEVPIARYHRGRVPIPAGPVP